MILLTGATGFLGSRILKELLKKKYEIICIKRNTSIMTLVEDYKDECIWINNDLMIIESVFQQYNIEVIIHCATAYGRNNAEALDVYDSNLTFPLKLFTFGKKYGSRVFINTGTFFCKKINNTWDKVYMDAYVKSKYMLQYILRDSVVNSNMFILDLQLEHLYGSVGGNGKFVDYILNSLCENVESISLTEGLQGRDWIYIDDAVGAYMVLLEQLSGFREGEFYQFEIGTGIETTVREFVMLAKELTNSKTKLEFGKREMNKNEIMHSCADNMDICSLGWKPQNSVKMGIEKMLREKAVRGDIKKIIS